MLLATSVQYGVDRELEGSVVKPARTSSPHCRTAAMPPWHSKPQT
jgi:hypothetical protein